MEGFQLSLYGRTSRQLLHQMTGWILEPCWNPSQTPKFQCLLLEDGQMPEWCEGDALTSHGDCLTPAIGEAPGSLSGDEEFFSWRILEASVPQKYSIGPEVCSRLLRLAAKVGCPPPRKIEYLLLKQGGAYPSSTHFSPGACAAMPSKATRPDSSAVLDGQLTLFPPC